MEGSIGITIFFVLCAIWQVKATFKCTAAGRFADPDDVTCQNYIFCIYDSSTVTYFAYKYVCPASSLFNPDTTMCAANHICKVTPPNNDGNGVESGNGSNDSNDSKDDNNSSNVTPPSNNDNGNENGNGSNKSDEKDINNNDGENNDSNDNNDGKDSNDHDDSNDGNDAKDNGSEENKDSNDSHDVNDNNDSNDIKDSKKTQKKTKKSKKESNGKKKLPLRRFKCISAGHFADPEDNTCQNYISCVYDSSVDTFHAYKYACPVSSLFNPHTVKCSPKFICKVSPPNNGAESGNNSNNSNDNNGSNDDHVIDKDDNDCKDCKKIKKTKKNKKGSNGSKKLPLLRKYKCTSAGHFADLDDNTCRNYILCVYDRYTVTFRAYKYVCPVSTYFNPHTAICSSNYACKVSPPNNNGNGNESGKDSNESKDDDDSNDSNNSNESNDSNDSKNNSDSNDGNDSKDNNDSKSNKDSDESNDSKELPLVRFKCISAGRFADPDDHYCQNYIFCIYDSATVTYHAYKYVCPASSLFNPHTSICASNYICKVTPPNNNGNSAENGNVSSDSNEQNSSDNDDNHDSKDSNNSNDHNDSKHNKGSNESNDNKDSDESGDSEELSLVRFKCTSAGRFADPDDVICQNYILCIYDSSTVTYRAYKYTCPVLSLFNPHTAMCAENYVCKVTPPNNNGDGAENGNDSNDSNESKDDNNSNNDDDVKDSNDSNDDIKEGNESNDSCKCTKRKPVCKKVGFIADPVSTDCRTYIECVESNRNFKSTKHTCPDDTYYDPKNKVCKSDYTCKFKSPSTDDFNISWEMSIKGKLKDCDKSSLVSFKAIFNIINQKGCTC